jgi:hypothetical protein
MTTGRKRIDHLVGLAVSLFFAVAAFALRMSAQIDDVMAVILALTGIASSLVWLYISRVDRSNLD